MGENWLIYSEDDGSYVFVKYRIIGIENSINQWCVETCVLFQKLVENLRLHFNEKFDQLFREKERTLDLIRQQIARLKNIQQDLVWPCSSKKLSYPLKFDIIYVV